MQLAPLTKASLAQLGLDQERDLERRRRALVRHPGDADHDPPAVECVERTSKLQRGLGGVEVMGLGLEVRDRLGHDPAAGRDHEVLVGEPLTVRQLDGLRGSSTRCTSPTTSVTRWSRRPRSRRWRRSARSPPMARYMNPGW